MQLEDLVGLHDLTGVDFSEEAFQQSWGADEQCNVINFVLDGVTYSAIEDPNDGYRSMMREVRVSDFKVSNMFLPVQVMCLKRSDSRYGRSNDILDCYDTKNGKLVLAVGTDNSDDYYPTWTAEFTPENMHINDAR